jgi:thiol-disulfide isomerase/thioredoxin
VEASATGDLAAEVSGALSAASAQGRTVIVYVGATWCEPCQRFHHAVEQGELNSVASLAHVRFLDFDLDRDRERLAAAGYQSKYIPLFALPGPDGRASGKQVEGGIKGDGAVAYMVPRLTALLAL